MESQQVLDFVQQYGYWILYPLSMIEGPLVTLIGGGFVALGVLRFELVLLIAVMGDLTMDFILYYVGFLGGQRLRNFIARHPRIENRRQKLQYFFEKHGGKVIFVVKLTVGLSYITFITAGLIRMPLRKFLFFSFLGGILWSGFLIALGYFYGNLHKTIGQNIGWAGLFIGSGALLTFIIMNLFKKWEMKKLFK